MYKETIIPKSAKHSIDIPKEFINKKVTVVFEQSVSPSQRAKRDRRAWQSRKNNPRKGWAVLFKQMNAEGDDTLLIPDSIGIDSKDWEW